MVVRDIPDDRLLEITLIENIQREDLNPIETATALARMSTELNLGPEEIGRRTGKDRTTIINFIRLLQLPPDLQQLVAERRLSAGHARCLLSLPSTEHPARSRGEGRHRRLVRPPDRTHDPEDDGGPHSQACERGRNRSQREGRHPGNAARPRHSSAYRRRSKKKGKIEIEYYSQDDLDRIYSVIVGDRKLLEDSEDVGEFPADFG